MSPRPRAEVVKADSVLTIRKKTDGTVVVEGEPPQEHNFSARWIRQAIEDGLVSVTVQLNTDNGPHVYRMTGFMPNDGGSVDLTTWAVALGEED